MNYVIRWNKNEGAYTCGHCGERMACVAGPELFSSETDDPICRECGQQLAPELVAMVDAHRSGTERGSDSVRPEEEPEGNQVRQTRPVRRFAVYRNEYPVKGLIVRIEDRDVASDGSILSVELSKAAQSDDAIQGLEAVLFAVSGRGSERFNRELRQQLGSWPSETA